MIITRIKNKIKYLIWNILDEKNRKLFYGEFIKAQDVVFDIGANHGNRTSVFLDIGAKVISVEPNPLLANKLKKKFGKRINVVQKAVGNKNGVIDLYVNDADVLSTTSLQWIEDVKKSNRFGDLGNRFSKQVEVEMLTLDDLIANYGVPKFIKIDVEGAELEIIKTIKDSRIQSLSFEFAIPESLDETLDILKHLDSNGYHFFNISFGESMQFLTNNRVSLLETTNLLNNLPMMSWGDIYAFVGDK